MTSTLGNWNRRREPRVGICLHFDGSLSDAGALEWLLRDPKCHVSYNWIVTDRGDTVDVAPEDARAWHAGVCRPSDRFRYQDANSALYGLAIAAKPGDTVFEPQMQAVVDKSVYLFRKHRWPASETWRITSHRAEAWPRGRKSDCEGDHLERPVLNPVVVRKLVALELERVRVPAAGVPADAGAIR